MRPTWIARAVVLERVLHRLLDFADVGAVLHVEEVDDDQPRHVAQPELPGDLARGLQVGRRGGLLDIMLARGPPRVDVDRHQSLGRVDHQIATGLQLHDRIVHGRQLVLDAEALEQRDRVAYCFTRRAWLGISSFMKSLAWR